MIDLNLFKQEGEKIIDFFKKDIQGLRTNRANVQLVSHLLVDVYGIKTPLEQLATITIPEPRSIMIQPWDKNLIKEIEATLTQADLGALPVVKDGVIHLNLPPLNEETRKKMVKLLQQKAENSRIKLRNLRDEYRSKILQLAKEKEISEDQKYRLLEDLDKKNKELMDEIETIKERKEKEIMTI
jgi:ribosome recycling factor